jgi:hypothetical protein
MSSSLLPLAAVTAVVVALTACNDPNAIDGRVANVGDTVLVYALTGTPPYFPTAYNSAARAITRADADFSYDIVFDIDAQGRVVIYPLQLVGGVFSSSRSVGVQKLKVPFNDLGRAPASGYVTDSTVSLSPGEGIVIQSQSSGCTALSFSPFLYTKLAIDSAKANTREIWFHTMHDPNCGYRSFGSGIPKN